MAGIAALPSLVGEASSPLIDIVRNVTAYLDKKFQDSQRDIDSPLLRLLMIPQKMSGSGAGYEKRSRVITRGAARFVGMYEPNTETQQDIFATHGSHWVHSLSQSIHDEKEVDMSSGPEQIVDTVAGRISDQYEAMVNLWTDSLDNTPTSNDDIRNVRSILYWLPTLPPGTTADYVGGFNGTTATLRDGTTTTTTIGRQDRSAARNARLRSYNAHYTGDIDDTFLDTFRRARTRTDFRTLDFLRGDGPAGGNASYVFAPHNQADVLEKRANKGPDDWRGDVNRVVDPTISGMKVVRVPGWDNLDYSPIVGVRIAKFAIRVLKDRWFQLGKPKDTPSQDEVIVTPLRTSALIHCDDPRSAGFTISLVR